MTTDPGALAETYFQAWKGQDFDTLRSVLAENATFRGPLGAADNADEYIAGLRGMSKTGPTSRTAITSIRVAFDPRPLIH